MSLDENKDRDVLTSSSCLMRDSYLMFQVDRSQSLFQFVKESHSQTGSASSGFATIFIVIVIETNSENAFCNGSMLDLLSAPNLIYVYNEISTLNE